MTMMEQVERDQVVARDLRARVLGPVLLSGDIGYDESRSLWNGMIDRRPAVILRCLGVAHVVAGVNAAREPGL